MRRASKRIFFFVITAILFFLWLSCAGIERRYGDVVNTFVSGIENVHWGLDLNGCLELIFHPITNTVPNSGKMGASASILQQRLFNRNLIDSKVFVNESKHEIIMRVPLGGSGDNMKELINELTAQSVLTFRDGTNTTENGKPRGETLSGILLTRKDVDKVSVFSFGRDFGVTIKFNEEGKKRFEEATSKLSVSGGVISIWLDDNLITALSVSDTITNGKASITGFGTIADAIEFANKMNTKELPFGFRLQNARVIEPRFGVKGKMTVLILLFGLGALAVILLMVFYRVGGIICSLALAGQFAVFVNALTGFLSSSSYLAVTIPVCLGLILVVGLNLRVCFLTLKRIKAALKDGKTAKSSINFGFQKNAIKTGRFALLLLGMVLIGCFGPPITLTNRVLNWLFCWIVSVHSIVSEPLYSLGRLLVAGVFADILFGFFAFKWMLMSLVRFKVFKNPAFYGVSLQHGETEVKQLTDSHNKKQRVSQRAFVVWGVLLAATAINVGTLFKLHLHPTSGWFLNFSYSGTLSREQVAKVAAEQKSLSGCVEIRKFSDVASGDEGFSVFANVERGKDLAEFEEALKREFVGNNIEESGKGYVTLTMGSNVLIKLLSVFCFVYTMESILIYCCSKKRKKTAQVSHDLS
ncbi:MAG: hypothetical protein LBJ83_03280 [Oscillospiraceae bacterium]|jgi:preprotein translocase subunit SecD|nr:hypothetical protein [Oscillospiraceae bacterium]